MLEHNWDKHPSQSFVFVDQTKVTGKNRRVGTTDFVHHNPAMQQLIGFLKTLPSDHLRILSARCSIGCEPYSFSMLAEKAGLYQGRRIEIDALDLSPLFVQAASEGLYPATMIADPFPAEFRHYFNNCADGLVQANDVLRRRIHVLPPQDLTKLEDTTHYDALIMLNLFIQLHEAQAAQNLADTIARTKPTSILLNNVLLVKREGNVKKIVPYTHWPILEESLRRTG